MCQKFEYMDKSNYVSGGKVIRAVGGRCQNRWLERILLGRAPRVLNTRALCCSLCKYWFLPSFMSSVTHTRAHTLTVDYLYNYTVYSLFIYAYIQLLVFMCVQVMFEEICFNKSILNVTEVVQMRLLSNIKCNY